MQKITSFTGEYSFLSNCFMKEIFWLGKKWPSVTHAYEAHKFLETDLQEKIRLAKTPKEAKSLSRSFAPLRLDWDIVKQPLLKDLLKTKFADPELKISLVNTKDIFLDGEKHTGKILMEIRNCYTL